MKNSSSKPETVDEYISLFPKDIQSALKKIRQTIKKTAPEAEEKISYQMPAYKLNGYLVYFAAWKNHVGFYPASATALKSFTKELKNFEISKGTIKFPFDEPIPFDLITKITEYRMKENLKSKK